MLFFLAFELILTSDCQPSNVIVMVTFLRSSWRFSPEQTIASLKVYAILVGVCWLLVLLLCIEFSLPVSQLKALALSGLVVSKILCVR